MQNPSIMSISGLVLAFALLAPVSPPADAARRHATYTTEVALTPATGTFPTTGLTTGADGLLYGTASSGGNFFAGTLFRVEAGGQITTLHHFAADLTDGGTPSGALMLSADGWLYGTTPLEGPGGRGQIFRLATDGRYEIVHDFVAGVADGGGHPVGALVQDAQGNLFGTLSDSSNSAGAVFKLAPGGHVSILHTFTRNDPGWGPRGDLLLDADGTLFGSTRFTGFISGGTLFSIGPSGKFRTLHAFSDNIKDGCNPMGAMAIGPDRRLYGTTYGCGAALFGHGTLYSITRKGTGFRVVHAFLDRDPLGGSPVGGVTMDSLGALYVTTSEGGSGFGGTVFKINRRGDVSTVLHAFVGGSATDGAAPYGPVTLRADGSLAGTTWQGGGPAHAGGSGTIFSVTLDP